MSDLENIKRLESTLFTPALQEAVLKAKDQGEAKDDTIYAIANAYVNMLIPFLGNKKAAETFLQQQLDYLRDQS